MNRHFKCALAAILFLSVVVALMRGGGPAVAQTAGLPTITNVIVLNPVPIPGEPVTLTGMVSSGEPSAGAPSGTVEFFDGPDSLGTATLEDSNGVGMASLTVEIPAGIYSIHAAYSGDYAFDLSVSSPSIPLRVLE